MTPEHPSPTENHDYKDRQVDHSEQITSATGIRLHVDHSPGGGTRLSSNLREFLPDREADALESLTISLISEGISAHDDRLLAALDTSTESIASNYGEFLIEDTFFRLVREGHCPTVVFGEAITDLGLGIEPGMVGTLRRARIRDTLEVQIEMGPHRSRNLDFGEPPSGLLTARFHGTGHLLECVSEFVADTFRDEAMARYFREVKSGHVSCSFGQWAGDVGVGWMDASNPVG